MASSIKGLENTIKLGKEWCCPKYVPINIRHRFVNAPCSSMWPEDQDLDFEMRNVCHSKRLLTENSSKASYRGARKYKRGQLRCSRSRGQFIRGNRRRGANRGSSDTQSRSDSNNPLPPNNQSPLPSPSIPSSSPGVSGHTFISKT